MRAARNTFRDILGVMGLLALLFGIPEVDGAEQPAEGKPTVIYVARFEAEDAKAANADSHLIAQELFLTALAATQKFTLAADPNGANVELRLHGRLAHAQDGWRLTLVAQRGKETQQLAPAASSSLEEAVEEAAKAVAALHKRSGYVLKREGNRIVIARGREEGIEVGQRFRTTDTRELFEVVSAAAHTAEGRILAAEPNAPTEPRWQWSGAPPALPGKGAPGEAHSQGPLQGGAGQVGAVDIVFVLDTTGSMRSGIDGVLTNVVAFSRTLEAQRLDARLGLVTFKEGVDKVYGFAPTPEAFRAWVEPLLAEGGGDETPFAALKAAQGLRFRVARRILILITDEPAYDAVISAGGWTPGLLGPGGGCLTTRRVTRQEAMDSLVAQEVLGELRRTGTVVFTITLRDAEGIYPYLAESTGGAFYDLLESPDFTTLLGNLGQRIGGMFIEQ